MYLIYSGNSGKCIPLRHDHRSTPGCREYVDQSTDDGYLATQLGDIDLLLRHASGPIPDDAHVAALHDAIRSRTAGHGLGRDVRGDGGRDDVAGSLRATILPWFVSVSHRNQD